MSALDCAGFEAALAEALAAAQPCEPSLAATLRDHAASCRSCRGSADLVDLLAQPASSRDPFPEPPPSYWSRFERELASRIGVERRRLAWRRSAGWAAAAVVVVALLAVPLLRDRPFRSETAHRPTPLDLPAADPDDSLDPFPRAGALDGFSDDDEPSLFPGAEDLSPEGEERLLEWLERERDRAAGGAA
jgi:hypothetical protein